MRKILFLIPLLFICTISTHSYAITEAECGVATTKDECPAGCYWGNDIYGCRVCGVGTYSEAPGQDSCTSCSIPKGGELTDTRTGLTTNSCEWTATCTEGQYWLDGSSESGSDTFGCTACPEYSGPMEGSGELSVSGSGYTASSDITSGDINSRCDANVITLLLHKNIDLSDTMYADHDVEAKYGVGFKILNRDDWAETINGAMQPNKKIIQFNGYNSASACNADMYFDTGGNLTQTWDALFGLGNPANLYACYTTSEVTINYFDPGDATEPWRTDTVGIDNGFVYNVVDYGGNYEDSGGQVFLSYTCNTGDGGSCGSVQPGNPLRILAIDATEINLVAQFGACPAGYYCTGGNKKPCPVGTTSDSGAETLKDCYMVAGENGTQFCDVNGCFTLPGTGNIAYE